jgi:hypothetical protein
MTDIQQFKVATYTSILHIFGEAIQFHCSSVPISSSYVCN